MTCSHRCDVPTCLQMQTGIKMVIFDFSNTTQQAPLVGLSILAINLELYLARTIVEKVTCVGGSMLLLHVRVYAGEARR